MYLKSLELQGFKSFPDKTKLTFEEGTTVIVGPNGSGKSNIADAMRWVLGEISSKSMRGTKMEDIIFGGASSRRPMGYAEVSVTFDNTDPNVRLEAPYDEVTVTRRYYRAGESEYFINRKAVRLRDIYELFLNTGIGRDGYSIIGQGKIAEIISRKSEERRNIFEDASGIAKFRHKKDETERKLAQTEENMTRVNDIFLEVEAQVGPLEKEAEKAKRAIELLEAKKMVDVQLWLYDTEKLRGDLSRAEELFARSNFELQTVTQAIDDLDAQEKHLFEASQSSKLSSERLLSEIREQTEVNHTLDSQYRVNETNIQHIKELSAGAEGAVSSIRKNVELQEASCRAHEEKIEAVGQKLTDAEAEQSQVLREQREECEKIGYLEEKLSESLADIRALEAEAVDVKVRLSVLENASDTASDRNNSIQSQIEQYARVSKTLAGQCDEKQRQVDEQESEIAKLDDSLDRVLAQIDEMGEREESTRDEIAQVRLRRDAAVQRMETFRAMEEQFEGYNNSVRYVMQEYAKGNIRSASGAPCGKIYGPLSQLVSVKDEYVTAIETALGTNLQNIVVEDEEVAKAAIFTLKRAQAGRATFFPLTSMKAQGVTPEMEQAARYAGYIDVADRLLDTDEKFGKIMSALLGRTVIFDNIDHATEMAKALRYRVRVVTLDGQQINVGGSFTGGAFKQKSNILGRAAEIRRLEKEKQAAEDEMATLESMLAEILKKSEQLEDEKSEIIEKRKLLLSMQSAEAAQLEQVKAKLAANDTLLDKLKDDAHQLETQARQHEENREVLRARRTELEQQIVEITAYREKKEEERNDSLDKKAASEAKLTELHIRLSELQKDIETENTLLATARAQMENSMAEADEQRSKITQYAERLRALGEEQKFNREQYSEGEKRLADLNEKRSAAEKDNFEFERKINEIHTKSKDKSAQKDIIFREFTMNENKLNALRSEQDTLSSKLWEEHELTRTAALELGYPALTAATRAAAAQKQTECRNKLRWIGNVDLDSVNKYKEVKERYDTMKTQIDDLTRARGELTGIIQRLEGEMKTAFMDAFSAINENFGRVFRELFGGGSAEITLSDPENILESGIEIKAAPPGKIIKSLMQLSGGEQSFVGVALFFAILQVNPTPFCILDEIEAALDEVNVARLAEYIKRYSDGTQFILITHRRGTMEAANRLYGVTMPEQGISKVLTLSIDDIAKKKEGDEWDVIFG